VLADAEVKVLIVSAEFSAVVEAMRERLTLLQRIVTIEDPSAESTLTAAGRRDSLERAIHLDETMSLFRCTRVAPPVYPRAPKSLSVSVAVFERMMIAPTRYWTATPTSRF